MSAKQLVFGEDARNKLRNGIDVVAEAVATTLGPKGRNVALDRKFGSPTITHDGVTVAKEIELEDPFENMGAQLLKEAATKTNDIAGDGTTTSTVLAHAMVTEGLKTLAAGANPMLLKHGIEAASKKEKDACRVVPELSLEERGKTPAAGGPFGEREPEPLRDGTTKIRGDIVGRSVPELTRFPGRMSETQFHAAAYPLMYLSRRLEASS